MLKKIDKLILSSFIGPYILSFFIAEFVLVMQFLWKYVDEILGKGYTILDIGEMIIYFMITQIPMALPISILLSSVMVYGSLAERYELSSMKSAGISLLRIMRPGILLAIFTALLSLLASNVLKPQANFQFQKRMKSIRSQKPALAIEEKIFNKDFKNYSIRVKNKLDDNESIEDILIYDHTNSDKSLLNMTKADHGRMFTSDDGAFVMELYDGTQYSEMKREYTKNNRRQYPLMRTNFKKWQKVFDTQEFNTDDFSVNINRNKEDMLNAPQLLVAIDSLDSERARYANDFVQGFTMKPDEDQLALEKKRYSKESERKKRIQLDLSSNRPLIAMLDLNDEDEQSVFIKAQESSRSVGDRLRITTNNIRTNKYKRSKYTLRLHQQFSFAFICIVFMFLGAPLGSIIRKGGFGYPLLYAIAFYMLFIMLAIMGEKLVKGESMNPVMAAWISNLILLPLALYLTIIALRDANTTIFSRVRDFIRSFIPKKSDA